jgi:thioester reductase-like protein
VLLLVRGKKHTSAFQRVHQLLGSPLFHEVQNRANLQGNSSILSRVQVVEGDLLLPGLGLSAADHALLREVDVVLHCAANLELEADIQHTLR